VLEEACFAASTTESGNGCQKYVTGTPGESDLRLRILDGGSLEIYGNEKWSFQMQASLACFGFSSTKSCSLGFASSDVLLFDATQSARCEANACGVCDCSSMDAISSGITHENWSRAGSEITLGWQTVGYCAKGDELWLGGTNSDDKPKVSYKFKKQSCAGVPLPCAGRTAAQCLLGGNCSAGACEATSTGNPTRCAVATSSTECGVLQGCEWDPAGCAGPGAQSCNFDNCGSEPGCSYGPPTEKCLGEADPCEWREVSKCAGFGCSVRSCAAEFSDSVSCQALSAVECAKAPGCVVGSGATPCTGTALCSQQTDAAVCAKLTCLPQPTCAGIPTACSTLTLNECASVNGCRREW
jgi:hypothetical protein